MGSQGLWRLGNAQALSHRRERLHDGRVPEARWPGLRLCARGLASGIWLLNYQDPTLAAHKKNVRNGGVAINTP